MSFLKQFTYISNWYVLAWCLVQFSRNTGEYLFLQGPLNLFILVVGLYSLCMITFTMKAPVFFKGLNILVGVLALYGLYQAFLGSAIYEGSEEIPPSSFFVNSLLGLTPLYVCYYYSYKGELTDLKLKFLVVVFVFLFIQTYFSYQARTLELLSKYGYTDIINSTSYLFVGLIPALFLFEKQKILQAILAGVILFFIAIGMKRGAVIVGVLGLLYVYRDIFKRAKSVIAKISVSLIVVVLVVVAYSYVESQLMTNEFFMSRLNDTLQGDSSGRDWIYTTALSKWGDMNLFQQLFGGGGYYSAVLLNIKGHNDWIELLLDCGLIGVVAYIYFYVTSIKSLRNTPKSRYKSMFISSMAILFLESFFSMGYESIELWAGIWMGFSLYKLQAGKTSMQRNVINNKHYGLSTPYHM